MQKRYRIAAGLVASAALTFALLPSARVCQLYAEPYNVRGDYSWTQPYTDNTPALAHAVADGCTSLVLPGGWVALKSPPPVLPANVVLTSEAAETSIVKDYPQAGAREIFIDTGAGGATVENVRIFNGVGFGGGTAIGHVAAYPGDDPQNVTLRAVVVSSFHTADQFTTCALIDSMAGTPNYGARRLHLADLIMAGGCSYAGLVLKQVNGVTISNLICGGTWGLWVSGWRPDLKSSNSITATGLVNCNPYLESTGASSFSGNTFDTVVTDNYSASNRFEAAVINTPPSLGGVNNVVVTNAATYR